MRLFRRGREADPEWLDITGDAQNLRVRLRRRPGAKRLTLRLSSATGELTLTAPPGIDLATIRRFLDSHAGWASARATRLPARIRWVADGTVPLRDVPHRIRHRPDGRAATGLGHDEDDRPTIEVGGDPDALPGRVTRFLRAEAARDLGAAVDRHAAALGRPAGRIAVRDTTSRWGSCSTSGTLSFSWRLILAPPLVLDYLAAHETAHLAEMNHSARFWALTRQLCPATDEAEAWLKRHGARLHRYGA